MSTSISPFMPPIVAFIASVTTGLTSFGDAVVFHVVWSLFGAVGLLPPETAETLQKAVLYLSILALTSDGSGRGNTHDCSGRTATLFF